MPGAGGTSNVVRAVGRPCNTPTPLSGGWLGCADGTVQRSERGTCSSSLPRARDLIAGIPPQLVQQFIDRGGVIECRQDRDCTNGAHGRCELSEQALPLPFCQYGCVIDAECAAGQVCVCGDPVGRCETAHCTSNADCGDGFACLQWQGDACPGYDVSCETSRDQCRTDEDCNPGQSCYLEDDGRHLCAFVSCDP
jgi:hypothetical protein